VAVCHKYVTHCYKAAQHVVIVATIIRMACKCKSVSGFFNRMTRYLIKNHAATNIVTACCTFITHCYKSARHVVKVATIISMAYKCNSVSGFFNSMARYLVNKACCHEYCESMLQFWDTLLQVCTACYKSCHNKKYGVNMQWYVWFSQQCSEPPDQLGILP
jgi:hypothetical protein